jgi:hypothetical protein
MRFSIATGDAVVRGERDDLRHLALLGQLHDRQRRSRAHLAEQRVRIARQGTGGLLHRHLRGGFGVFPHRLNGLAEHAVVAFLEGDGGAAAHVLADDSPGTAERHDACDTEGVLRQGAGAAEQATRRQRRQAQTRCDCSIHVLSPVCDAARSGSSACWYIR